MSDGETAASDQEAAETLLQLGAEGAMQGPNQEMLQLERERHEHDLRVREMDERQQKQLQDFQKQQHEFQAQLQAQQHEFQLKLMRLQTELVGAKTSQYKGPKVPKFEEGEDVDAYLRTFEKLAKVHEWPEATWATRLAGLLSGKALDAYSKLPPAESEDYKKVRKAILKRYELTGEAYRAKFRTTRKQKDDSYGEWRTIISGFLDRWLETMEVDSFDKLKDIILMEQLLEQTPPYLQVWLRERKLKDSDELVDMADHYLETHKKTERNNYSRFPDGKKQPSPSTDKVVEATQGKPKSVITCYSCNKTGHKANQCPNRKTSQERQKAFRCHAQQLIPNGNGYGGGIKRCGNRHRYPGKVDGQRACILRDTGCDQTIVCSNLVSPDSYLDDQYVNIEFADGNTKLLPLAVIHVECQCYEGQILAAVLDTLPEDVLLGNDIEDTDDDGCCKPAFLVTRRQAQLQRQRRHEELIDVQKTGVQPKSVSTNADSPCEQTQCDEPYSNSIDGSVAHSDTSEGIAPIMNDSLPVSLEQGDSATQTSDAVLRPAQDYSCEGSRSQPESAKEPQSEGDSQSENGESIQSKEMTDEDIPHTEDMIDVFDIDPTEMRRLQQNCPTLSGPRRLAVTASQVTIEDVCFYWKDGLLYRKWKSRVKDGRILNQLVVPKHCRETLLRLAHDIPLAGHLGVEKTKRRLLQHYYWPGIFPDVASYCRTCEACQKAANRKAGVKAKLIPMPVLEEPFQRIAMDMIGPLPRTARGNRYVLTIIDYATRYPEAIPVPTLEAERIAEELVTVYSRV
ncbi:uncharacterized protein LOC144441327 [Glandiceps talaboti]